MNKARRIGTAAVYYLAWLCIVTVVTYLLLCLPFLINPDLRLDDDIAYLVGIPIGLIIFFPLANKLVNVRALHKFNIVAGVIGIVASIPVAGHMFRRSAALTGVTGPFAGMGETIVGCIMVLVGVFGVVVTLAGVTGLRMGIPTRHQEHISDSASAV
jgi:hypothetical protein